MIPRRAHFIWINTSDEGDLDAAPPPDYVARTELFRLAHPEWEVTVWTGRMIQALVFSASPGYYETTFLGYPYPVMRIDAARYFILREHGGVYMDMDQKLVAPLDPLLAAHPDADALVWEETYAFTQRTLTNSFIASAPGSALASRLVARLEDPYPYPGGDEEEARASKKATIFHFTGPTFFARVVEEVEREQRDQQQQGQHEQKPKPGAVVRLQGEIRNCGCCTDAEMEEAAREGGVYVMNENVGSWRGAMFGALRGTSCGLLETTGLPSSQRALMATMVVIGAAVIMLVVWAGISILRSRRRPAGPARAPSGSAPARA
jgi:hypothetical protein